MHPAIKLLVGPLAELLKVRSERKAAKTALKAKAELVKAGHKQEMNLSEQEWEIVIAMQFDRTWKDEYALLVGTSFIPLLIFGCLWYAFTGDYALINGVVMSMQVLDASGVPVGTIITALLFAASGISLYKMATR